MGLRCTCSRNRSRWNRHEAILSRETVPVADRARDELRGCEERLRAPLTVRHPATMSRVAKLELRSTNLLEFIADLSGIRARV